MINKHFQNTEKVTRKVTEEVTKEVTNDVTINAIRKMLSNGLEPDNISLYFDNVTIGFAIVSLPFLKIVTFNDNIYAEKSKENL